MTPGGARFSELLPSQTNLRTRLAADIWLNIPILSAAMDTVTEGKLAIALAREGGIGNYPPQPGSRSPGA